MDAKLTKALDGLRSTCEVKAMLAQGLAKREMIRCSAAELMRWIRLEVDELEQALEQYVRETSVGDIKSPKRIEWAKQQLAFEAADVTNLVAMLNLLIQEKRHV